MTQQEALAEAKKRFGITARAWTEFAGIRNGKYIRKRIVGVKTRQYRMDRGCGETWEAAFAEAELRQEISAAPPVPERQP